MKKNPMMLSRGELRAVKISTSVLETSRELIVETAVAGKDRALKGAVRCFNGATKVWAALQASIAERRGIDGRYHITPDGVVIPEAAKA